MNKPTDLQLVSRAFGVLFRLLQVGGRRVGRARAEESMNVSRPDPMNTARFVKMAPRAERRAKQGKDFKPVIGHAPPAAGHKQIVAAMKVKNRKTKAAWFKEQK